MNNPVDVILTCCGRFDLLQRTLHSFFKVNTYPIRKFVVYDDKGLNNYTQFDWEFVHILQQQFNKVLWIQKRERVGQILSLDRLMQEVETDYYFNCEEDWIFLKDGFIPESINVLKKYPMCNQVQLRGAENINGHPSVYKDGVLRLTEGYRGKWNGWGFNPSVRRRSDYELIGRYSDHTEFSPTIPYQSEIEIANIYHKMGYFTAVLPNTYITHIGEKRGIRK